MSEQQWHEELNRIAREQECDPAWLSDREGWEEYRLGGFSPKDAYNEEVSNAAHDVGES